MIYDDADDAVREAERIIYRAKWRMMESGALRVLACTRGLAYLPIFPGHEVIQVVTYDGEHIGHIRRVTGPGTYDRWIAAPEERWVAIPTGSSRPLGSFGNPYTAAEALIPAGRRRSARSRLPKRS